MSVLIVFSRCVWDDLLLYSLLCLYLGIRRFIRWCFVPRVLFTSLPFKKLSVSRYQTSGRSYPPPLVTWWSVDATPMITAIILQCIEGNCDERGAKEYNLALGDKRASAAKQYLSAAGIPAARIDTISYGKEKPLCTESTEECWTKNRRDHFVLN